MLGRCGLFLAFNLLFATVSLAESFDFLELGDTVKTNGEAISSKPVIWEPSINGLSRFSLSLPQDGIRDAIQHEDTSALFYTSLTNDKGLEVTRPAQTGITLNVTPNDFLLGYEGNFTPNFSYRFGAKVDDSGPGPQFNLKYRTVARPLSLDLYDAFFNNGSSGVIWSRTSLINDEEAELLRSLGLYGNQIYAGAGLRTFEIFGNNDAAVALHYKSNELSMFGQIEIPWGQDFAYVGLGSNLNSGELLMHFGLLFTLDELFNLKFSAKSPSEILATPSLRALRRDALPGLWRSRVQVTDK